MIPIYFAPLQGFTEDAYRRLHHEWCGGIHAYATPFIRLIHGELRSKDMRDMRREFNQGVPVIPQIMAGDCQEFRTLVDAVLAEGYKKVDINMGCPFPLQTRHGHGAGLLPHPDRVEQLCAAMREYPDVDFSVKMRLGLESSGECMQLLPVLNDAPLHHVTLHPRVATQQYTGMVDMDAFVRFMDGCNHPLIYNGDVTSVKDILTLVARYPMLHGIMVGRGLLANPMLAAEYAAGSEYTPQKRLQALRTLHDCLLDHYRRIIPGEAAQLQKVRTFWTYTEPTIGHKAWKKLKKAGSMRNYLAAVESLV